MKKYLLVLAVLIASFAQSAVAAHTTLGYSRSKPVDWGTASATESTKPFKTYYEWDEDNGEWRDFNYVYVAKIQVPYGRPFTIWSTSRNCWSMEINSLDTEDVAYYSTMNNVGPDWDGNQRYKISWSDNDAEYATVPFLIVIQSENLEDSVTICYQLEDVNDASIPMGDSENPEKITPSPDGTSSYPRTMPNDQYGTKQSDYAFLAYLESSHTYLLEGVSGTSTYPLSLQVYAGEDIVTNPVVSVISATNSYNDAVRITPLQTGYYNLSVHTWNTTFTIRSTGKRGRLPYEHNSTVLVPGEAARFTPGHIISPGSGYVDDIIDECLFRFTAKGGDTYRLTTTGAATNLLMRLYDANGQTLLEEPAKSAFDGNIFSVFSIEKAGVYYIGVCEHLADDASDTPTGRSASVLLEKVTGDKSLWDEYDDADDVVGGATVLNPLRTAVDDSPSTLGAETSGPHRLSATDLEDWFSFAARTDFVYRVQIAETEGRFDCPDWVFGLMVSDPEGNETLMLPDSAGIVRIAPKAVGTFSMRVSVVRTGDGREMYGAASPAYTVAMTAYAADADEYGEITMMPKGPGAESDVKWRLAGTTVWYPAGAFVLAKGTVTIEAGAVDGFSTPDAFQAGVLPGASTTVVATYNDVFDPDDDLADGAVEIAVSSTLQLFPRTMWGSATAVDAADWFAFNVAEGVYYEFSIESIAPATAESYSGLEMELFDLNGVLLAASTNSISWGAPANGACRLVVHASNPGGLCCGLEPIADCSYALSAYSVDVGSIKIKYPEIELTDVDDTAEVVVYRTASEGTVRVDYGTIGATAIAGVDYEAEIGTLEWLDGDASEKTISVRVVPSILPTSEGERMFYVRLWPSDADDGYPAVVAAPQAATVRVVPSAAGESAGMLSFTGWGCPADVFEDPDHPEITVAPGDDVRLWVSRSGGSNGVAVVEATVSGDVGDWYAVATSRASWRHGDMGDKFIGLRIGEDVPAGVSTLYVRMDVTDGNGVTVGSRRVVVHVDSSRAQTEADEDDEAVAALSAFSGKYSVALVAESGTGPSTSVSCGYVVFEIGNGLSVSVHGALPDGTAVDEVAEASFSGDALAPAAGVVRIAFNGESALSGSLGVSIQDGVPVVLSEGGALFACDAAETPIVPVGGLWEPVVDLRALFAGKSLSLATVGRVFDVEPLAHGFKASGGIMGLDADTGVLSVGNDGMGACLQHADSLHFSQPIVAFGGFGGRNGFLLVSEDVGIESDEFWAEELPVTVVFDGNGNTSGEILGDAIVETFAGSYDIAPYVSDDFAMDDGFVFIGWMSMTSGEIVAPGGLFKVGAMSETYVAAWHELGDAEIAAAVGDPELEFHTFGDVLWSVDHIGGTDGGPAARSGNISPSQSSTLVADTVGSGLLAFDWKASCDVESYARCTFCTNDVEVARVSGKMSDWTNVTISVASGVQLSWKYELYNGAYTNQGANAVWVDNVRFAVAGGTVPVKFVCGEGATCSVTTTVAVVGKPFGELPIPESSTRRFVGWTMDGDAVTAETIVPDFDCVLVAQWDYFVWTVSFDANGADNAATATPNDLSDYENNTVHIPGSNGLAKAGYAFGGWTDGIGGVWNDEDYIITATNITLKAIWSLAGLDTVLGPGAAAFAFDTSGAAEWFVTSDNAYDAGGTSMRSGAIGNGFESVLTATAKSSGTLSFKWAASCDDINYAWCSFAVKGVEKGRIGGDTNWTAVEVDVAAGDVLTWTYTKSSSAYNVGSDCAWVDALSFGKKTTVTFVAEGSDPATTNVVAFAGEPIGELPYPTWTDYSLDYWADPTGGVVTAEWIVPEEAVTLTAVTKAKEWRVTYDLAGGTAVTVTNESYVAGATFALPGADSATKDGYALAGWSDGNKTYNPGATFTVTGGADLAFTAEWAIDYAAILNCSGQGLEFESSGDLAWIAADNEGDEDGTLQSGWIVASQSSVFRIKVPADGTLAFEWRTSFDNGGSQYAYCEIKKNADVVDSVSTAQVSSWTRREFTLNAGDEVLLSFVKGAGAYSKPDSGAGEDRVLIKSFVWTPDKLPEYEFTVNWAADAGVQGARYSIEDGDQDVEAENGEAIAVPDGKKITVVGFADTNNWYYITGGTGTWSIAASTIVTAAKRDVSTPATAEEVGLSGAFADADVNVVSNVMSWAQANDKTVADVNAMTFGASGDPVGVDAEAYLLNCAPADVATEAAKFKVTSFSVDASGNISITPADGDAFGNGTVELRYADTPKGPFSSERPAESGKLFIRLYLVR